MSSSSPQEEYPGRCHWWLPCPPQTWALPAPTRTPSSLASYKEHDDDYEDDGDDDKDDDDDHLIIEERWEWGQWNKLTIARHRSEKPLVRHQTTLIIIVMNGLK